MHSDSPESIIQSAERLVADMQQARGELRKASRPGDPEREERIASCLQEQLFVMGDVRSLMARAQWNERLLSEAQASTLSALSKALAHERRQLKKMRR